jgi:hypothetical protein
MMGSGVVFYCCIVYIVLCFIALYVLCIVCIFYCNIFDCIKLYCILVYWNMERGEREGRMAVV